MYIVMWLCDNKQSVYFKLELMVSEVFTWRMLTEGFVFSLALKRRYMQHIDCMSAQSVDMCVCVELRAGSDPNGLQWQAISLRTHDIQTG